MNKLKMKNLTTMKKIMRHYKE